jgi:small GTP-binding protein
MSDDYDFLFKILILGDSGVGKSCIMLKFTENLFSMNHVPTIGVDFKFKVVKLKGSNVKLQIWDTAGQERFKTLARTYYNGAMGIVITYDCTKRESFENVRGWLETIKLQASEHTALVLVGNKADLDDKQVSDQQGRLLAEDLAVKFFLTSAKTGQGISEVFESLACEIFDRRLYELIGNAANKRLSNKSSKSSKLKSCCK